MVQKLKKKKEETWLPRRIISSKWNLLKIQVSIVSDVIKKTDTKYIKNQKVKKSTFRSTSYVLKTQGALKLSSIIRKKPKSFNSME